MDPEIVILDGSSDDMKLTWNGMSDLQQIRYYYVCEDRQAIEQWLITKGTRRFGMKQFAAGMLGAAALGGAAWKLKHRK